MPSRDPVPRLPRGHKKVGDEIWLLLVQSLRVPLLAAGPIPNMVSPEIMRREALIKLGKYTAYATPILLASVSWPHAQGDPHHFLLPPAPTVDRALI